MEIFNAIGLEISKEKTLSDLAANTELRGEASLSTRSSGIVHGRCWRIGSGLEVWKIFYESETGEFLYADCRPGFRARFTQNVSDWLLYETVEGKTTVCGVIENHRDKVSFQLQNLTEVAASNFERKILTIGLCGLAYRAEVSAAASAPQWKSRSPIGGKLNAGETDWSLNGRVINFNALRNPLSGNDLYWMHLDLGSFRLEVLVNEKDLHGELLHAGADINADVWLQGHIVSPSTFPASYEGIDWSYDAADFWSDFKKLN